MLEQGLLAVLDFEVGDEVWWFKIGNQAGCLYEFSLRPGDIELVHDTIKEIKDGDLHCWHGVKRPKDIWGKTRQEAWDNLKQQLEKWGKFQ